MNNICIRHALRTGIAGSIGCSIYLFIYQSHCIWIVISALLLCQTHTTGNFINLFKHAIDRIIATGIGVFLGMLGYTLIFLNVNDSNKEIIPLICLFIFIISDSILQLTEGLNIITITAAIIMLVSIQEDSAIPMALARSMDIITGSAIGIIVSLIIPAKKVG
ncbi:MAG: hypothetical protein CMF41_05670 [Legionellales bacterium]|nr:hypothetical protein [Legionellales bacterium]OUX64401.1 MAG: hypothetical protein CBE41_03285 [Gammaproteobacteria bacterium TMED281]